MNDGLICGTCKGEKVIRTPVSNYTKVDICPLCKAPIVGTNPMFALKLTCLFNLLILLKIFIYDSELNS